MKKVILIKKDKINNFYKKIYFYRFLKLFKVNFLVKYNEKIYTEKLNNIPIELEKPINCIKILNCNNKRDKLNLIYDYSCDYLDNEFVKKNLCEFRNNMCGCNRVKNKSLQVSSCCESLKSRTICKHFNKKEKHCNIRSISCKLFVCPYLKKKGINYSVNKIVYIKYFLSLRQKCICLTSHFQDKDEVVSKMMKIYKWY